jgi:hypothetical protein
MATIFDTPGWGMPPQKKPPAPPKFTGQVSGFGSLDNKVQSTLGGLTDQAADAFGPTSAVPSEAPSAGGELDKPTESQDWWSGVKDWADPRNMTQPRNRQSELSDQFDPNQKSYQEQLYGTGANTDEFYNRAFDVGADKLNTRFRHSGFGSSSHADAMSAFGADLFADQAKYDSDYRLRAAQGADQGRGDRYSTAATLAGGADDTDIDFLGKQTDRFQTGTTAAATADGTRLARDSQSFEEQLRYLEAILGPLLGGFGDITGSSEKYLDAGLQGDVSASEDAATAAGNEGKQFREDLRTLVLGYAEDEDEDED